MDEITRHEHKYDLDQKWRDAQRDVRVLELRVAYLKTVKPPGDMYVQKLEYELHDRRRDADEWEKTLRWVVQGGEP